MMKKLVSEIFKPGDSFAYLKQQQENKEIDFQVLTQVVWLNIDQYPHKIIFRNQLENHPLTQASIDVLKSLVEPLGLRSWRDEKLHLFLFMLNTLTARLLEYTHLLERIDVDEKITLGRIKDAQQQYLWALRVFWLDFAEDLKKADEYLNELRRYILTSEDRKFLLARKLSVKENLPEEIWQIIYKGVYSEQRPDLGPMFDGWWRILDDLKQLTDNTPLFSNVAGTLHEFSGNIRLQTANVTASVDQTPVKKLLMIMPHLMHAPEQYDDERIMHLTQAVSCTIRQEMKRHPTPIPVGEECWQGILLLFVAAALLTWGICAFVASGAWLGIVLATVGVFALASSLHYFSYAYKIAREYVRHDVEQLQRATKDIQIEPSQLRAYAHKRQQARHKLAPVKPASKRVVNERTPLLKAYS